nr:MAG TPA: protein of unknown function (DUF5479) [Caudoviricetes sp.]
MRQRLVYNKIAGSVGVITQRVICPNISCYLYLYLFFGRIK